MRKTLWLPFILLLFWGNKSFSYDRETDFPFFVLSNTQYKIAIFNGKTHQWIKDVDLSLYANDFYLRNDGIILVRNVGLAHQGNAGFAVIDSQKNKVIEQLPFNNPMESDIYYEDSSPVLFTSGLKYRHHGIRVGILNPDSLKLEHEFWTEGWIKGAKFNENSILMYIASYLPDNPQFLQEYNLTTKRLESPQSLQVKYRRGIFDDTFFYGIDGKMGTLSTIKLEDQSIHKTLKLVTGRGLLVNIKWYEGKIMIIAQGPHPNTEGVLLVVDPVLLKIEHRISVGEFPHDVCGYPQLKKVFVVNYFADTISIIDTTTWTVTDTVSSKVDQPIIVRCFLPNPEK